MDGFEVLEAMRTRAATRDVPVIVVTGQTLSDADIERLNHGVATILSKGVFTARRDDRPHRAARSRAGACPARRANCWSARRSPSSRPITPSRSVATTSPSTSRSARTTSPIASIRSLGITPIAYLNRCRIRQAKELLDRTDRPITDIAMEVGFSDVSHFTRTFHREVGVSPRAYRRKRCAAAGEPGPSGTGPGSRASRNPSRTSRRRPRPRPGSPATIARNVSQPGARHACDRRRSDRRSCSSPMTRPWST